MAKNSLLLVNKVQLLLKLRSITGNNLERQSYFAAIFRCDEQKSLLAFAEAK